ncbi:hypothetical protein ERO13_D03G089400v2 [Gossypium hirsutum]|uniref:Protein ABIL1 n=1 Tax=Gossypium hirsutum TaxID=3635 RepID=A0A1U8NNC1_GOSHI|nr:protein ABIL1-like [Gossypium hirsutum]XP_040945978.1 protein ABIL1-like [Gossypium hirsutum]XP_040945979.1 protein ABIL1-like [Gossypium hirsutum]KAG4155070.1 hypothetical protein ERO13_D03G089400v2 [Gossypium hirsutum]KAG4155071.1 hypothetical protein ERO13_D03G089400v2 [Gossypium hirsutum]
MRMMKKVFSLYASMAAISCFMIDGTEGIKQQQLLAFIPRHHKHYILPNFVSKKVHFSPQLQTDPRQNHLHAKSCLQPSGLLRTSKMLMLRQLALLNSCII